VYIEGVYRVDMRDMCSILGVYGIMRHGCAFVLGFFYSSFSIYIEACFDMRDMCGILGVTCVVL